MPADRRGCSLQAGRSVRSRVGAVVMVVRGDDPTADLSRATVARHGRDRFGPYTEVVFLDGGVGRYHRSWLRPVARDLR